MKIARPLLTLLVLSLSACHPGPVVTTDPKLPVGGTIAGIVLSEAKTPVVGRKVTAINTDTGSRYDAATGANGGYTIKVPEGTYKIEVELQTGETIAKQPGPTRVNKSDLDPRRDFIIAGVRSGG